MKTAFLGLTSVLALSVAMPLSAQTFNRIASFPVANNIPDGTDMRSETSAEIIEVTPDGMTLVYTDSPLGVMGMIDISDPANPAPGGVVPFDGEPTAVAIVGPYAFVGINTSADYVRPSGYLSAVVVATGEVAAECDLGGQPDSVAAAPDGSFVAVAIENERDEDLNDGILPQLPAGNVAIVPLDADAVPQCDAIIFADVSGLAEVAGSDPEPEFVDVNGLGEIVVSLQENNHLVVLSSQGEVLSHFSAGTVTLEGVDLTEEGALIFDDVQSDRAREPDAVKWIDDDHFATANEGDYEGGSRGWTIFRKDGTVVYDSGMDFEYAIVRVGHYPEERSGNKGVEPESVEVGTFGGTPMVFIGAERSSIVGVYDITDPASPVLSQLLPSGVGPEGYVAIPERNLLISANETDLVEDGGPRAHVMIFEYGDAEPMFPTLISTDDADGRPIGWGAISGMVAGDDGMIYAVNDSFYAGQPSIFTIDPAQAPATITARTLVTRENLGAAQMLDLEGIATDGEGGFWLASEGRLDRNRPHTLLHVDADGVIQDEVPLPQAMLDNESRFGMEGVTRVGDMLYIAMQREWRDDPEGMVKILSYDTEAESWAAVHYPLEASTQGWVGLSEITAHDGQLYIIERDNQIGADAAIKRVYTVVLDGLEFGELGSDLPVVDKVLYRDLLPDLAQFNGYVVDKVEGMAITSDGTIYISTDNDGVDDSSGETHFFTIE